MKKAIYLCDECGNILSNQVAGVARTHLSLHFAPGSGIYEKVYTTWQRGKSIGGIVQFCDGDCLGTYFNKLIHKHETAKTIRVRMEEKETFSGNN